MIAFVLDEASAISPRLLADLLSEGRKFGVGALVATQYPGRLAPDARAAAEGAAGTHVVFRVPVPVAADTAASGPDSTAPPSSSCPRCRTGRGSPSGRAIPGDGGSWRSASRRPSAATPGNRRAPRARTSSAGPGTRGRRPSGRPPMRSPSPSPRVRAIRRRSPCGPCGDGTSARPGGGRRDRPPARGAGRGPWSEGNIRAHRRRRPGTSGSAGPTGGARGGGAPGAPLTRRSRSSRAAERGSSSCGRDGSTVGSRTASSTSSRRVSGPVARRARPGVDGGPRNVGVAVLRRPGRRRRGRGQRRVAPGAGPPESREGPGRAVRSPCSSWGTRRGRVGSGPCSPRRGAGVGDAQVWTVDARPGPAGAGLVRTGAGAPGRPTARPPRPRRGDASPRRRPGSGRRARRR